MSPIFSLEEELLYGAVLGGLNRSHGRTGVVHFSYSNTSSNSARLAGLRLLSSKKGSLRPSVVFVTFQTEGIGYANSGLSSHLCLPDIMPTQTRLGWQVACDIVKGARKA